MRKRPKIDRLVCPWLVSRFVDESPEFIYLPASDVVRIATETGAIPYDEPNIEAGPHGEPRHFDAFIARYQLQDAALNKLSLIVRGAFCGQPELSKEAACLRAISASRSA